MNNENRIALESEIRVELANLAAMEMGSEPYKVAVDGLTKLIDKAIELKKLDNDVEEKERDRKFNKKLKLEQTKLDNEFKERQLEMDNLFKERQLKIDTEFKRKQIMNEKVDRSFNSGIAIAGIVIPSIITVWGTFKTLKFEEHGTVTTIMGRGFINKLIPKK